MSKRKHKKHWRPIIIISVIALILVGAIIAFQYDPACILGCDKKRIDHTINFKS